MSIIICLYCPYLLTIVLSVLTASVYSLVDPSLAFYVDHYLSLLSFLLTIVLSVLTASDYPLLDPSLAFYVDHYSSLLSFSFDHCIVCPYGFWLLPCWSIFSSSMSIIIYLYYPFLLTIVLSVLTASDYPPVDPSLAFYVHHYLSLLSFSFDHCIVWPYGFWLPSCWSIFSFLCRPLSVLLSFSFNHCIVCPYGFWLLSCWSIFSFLCRSLFIFIVPFF